MAKKKTRRPAAAGVTRGEFNALKADVAALATTASAKFNTLDGALANLTARIDSAEGLLGRSVDSLNARIDAIVVPAPLPSEIVEKVTKLREELDALKAEVGGGAFQLPRES